MKRLPNWQTLLSDYLLSVDLQPFKYGSLDCGSFTAGAILAMTGVDPIAEIRGTYRTRKAAFAAIRSLSNASTMEGVADYLTERYGLAETPVLCAHRGDPVLIGHGAKSSMGIVAMHSGEILSPGEKGIYRLPIHTATRLGT